jgi:hypothetical protein
MLKSRKITEKINLNLVEGLQEVEKQIDDLVDSWSSLLKKELITGTTDVDRNLWDKFKDFIDNVSITPQGLIQTKSPRRMIFGKNLSPDFSQYWSGSYQKPKTAANDKTDFKKLWTGKYQNKMSLEDYRNFQEIFSMLSEESNTSSIKIFQIIDKHANELRKKLKDLFTVASKSSSAMPALSYQLSPKEIELVRQKSDTEIPNVKKAIEKAPIEKDEKEKVLKIINKYIIKDQEKTDDKQKPVVGSSSSFRGLKKTSTETKPTVSGKEETKPTVSGKEETKPTVSGKEETKPTVSTETKPTVSGKEETKTVEDNLENVPAIVKRFVHVLENQKKLSQEIKDTLKNWPSRIDDFYSFVTDILLDEIKNLETKERKHLRKQIEETDNPINFLKLATTILMKLGDD